MFSFELFHLCRSQKDLYTLINFCGHNCQKFLKCFGGGEDEDDREGAQASTTPPPPLNKLGRSGTSFCSRGVQTRERTRPSCSLLPAVSCRGSASSKRTSSILAAPAGVPTQQVRETERQFLSSRRVRRDAPVPSDSRCPERRVGLGSGHGRLSCLF